MTTPNLPSLMKGKFWFRDIGTQELASDLMREFVGYSVNYPQAGFVFDFRESQAKFLLKLLQERLAERMNHRWSDSEGNSYSRHPEYAYIFQFEEDLLIWLTLNYG